MIEPIRLELPTFEDMSVNSWLFKGEENILIDCGERSTLSINALNNQLAQHGLRMEDISKVIITHAHYDHIGMAQYITQNSQATIWVSEMAHIWAVNLHEMLDRRSNAIDSSLAKYIETEQLSNFDEWSNEMILEFWQTVPEDRLEVFPMSGVLDINGVDWEIIYTPGHCLNQTCFYQRESGYLLSADMLLPIIPLPIMDAKREAPFEAVKSLLMHYKSYDSLTALDIKKVFPGHMAAFENASEIIEKQKSRILSKKEKCMDLIDAGMNNFIELINNIYPNKVNMATALMVVGILEMLEEEGRIEVDIVNNKPIITALQIKY